MDTENLTYDTDMAETLASETEATSNEENAEVVETQGQEVSDEPEQIDVNAIAAAARRKAEQQARDDKARRDAEVVRRFGNLSNPKTGEPIRSEEDYWKALDDQEEMRAKSELESKGIDPTLIDNLIKNNPLIRQAQSVMEQNRQQATLMQINNDIMELNKLDPSITSLDSIPKEIVDLSMQSDGAINLVNAYKIINYGKVTDTQKNAITQSAINQAKGKQHLSPVNGIATPDEGVDIPNDVLSMWKEMFPDKTNAELKKLYNNSL